MKSPYRRQFTWHWQYNPWEEHSMNSCDQKQALAGSLAPRALAAGMIAVATVLVGIGCQRGIESDQSTRPESTAGGATSGSTQDAAQIQTDQSMATHGMSEKDASHAQAPAKQVEREAKKDAGEVSSKESAGDKEAAALTEGGPIESDKAAGKGAQLPPQIERDLTEEQVPAVLEEAIQARDIVLVDRIAWQTKNKEAEKKAEDFLAEIRQAFLSRLQREVKGGSATVPAGGVAVGEATASYSGSASNFSKKLEANDLPDGFHVVFGKWSVTRSSFEATYGVVVDDSVKPGGHELGFTVLLYDGDAKEKENPESMGPAPVKLKLRVTQGTVTPAEAQGLYSVAMWHLRRYREYRGQARKLLVSAVGLLGGSLTGARHEANRADELQRKSGEHLEMSASTETGSKSLRPVRLLLWPSRPSRSGLSWRRIGCSNGSKGGGWMARTRSEPTYPCVDGCVVLTQRSRRVGVSHWGTVA